jgi:hypothetical protein
MLKDNFLKVLLILAELIVLFNKGISQREAAVCTAAKFNNPLEDILQIIGKYFNKKTK